MENLKKYQEFISDLIQKDLEENPNFRIPKIQEASKFALTDGKRLRPIIILSICNCLNNLTKQNLDAVGGALAIEYIHNSSLIIDDLPMMDNDIMRRGKPTVHVQYGECVAQLVSYNLIIVAMRHVSDNLNKLSQAPFLSPNQFLEISHLVYQVITDQLSINGLCGGQYMDLHVKEEFKDLDLEHQKKQILDLIKRKTSCLFEISFLLGWIFGGGILEKSTELREIGQSFGLVFQIIDDLEDYKIDLLKENDNNICQYYKKDELKTLFSTHLELVREGLEQLQIFTPVFKELYNHLLLRFSQEIKKN